MNFTELDRRLVGKKRHKKKRGFDTKGAYNQMLQNQMTALFDRTARIYRLKDNPCSKVKRMGKSDINKRKL